MTFSTESCTDWVTADLQPRQITHIPLFRSPPGLPAMHCNRSDHAESLRGAPVDLAPQLDNRLWRSGLPDSAIMTPDKDPSADFVAPLRRIPREVPTWPRLAFYALVAALVGLVALLWFGPGGTL